MHTLQTASHYSTSQHHHHDRELGVSSQRTTGKFADQTDHQHHWERDRHAMPHRSQCCNVSHSRTEAQKGLCYNLTPVGCTQGMLMQPPPDEWRRSAASSSLNSSSAVVRSFTCTST